MSPDEESDETTDVVRIYLGTRPDGGLRVWSDDEPGLILSGADRNKVGADIVPALDMLRKFRKEGAV